MFFLSCKTEKYNDNCDKVYNTYIIHRLDNKDKKALIFLNNAIKCDSINQNYRFEKVKYLISLKMYTKAKIEVENLSFLNPKYLTHFPILGLIEIKLGEKEKGEKTLEKVHKELEKTDFNKENFNLFYNSILLELYINGKEYALLKIQENSHIYNKSQNEKESIEALILLLKRDASSTTILNQVYGLID